MVITIIGGGATALAFLYNYLDAIPVDNTVSTTIYLVEQRGIFGPGAAYAPDLPSNILNTKTGYITPFHNRPGDFFNWLRDNQPSWRRNFPDFVLDPEAYAPRPLFGCYLQAKMAWIVKQALMKSIRIIQVDAEVKDIAPVGASYVTKTDCSLNLTSDYVFLCCGTLPAKKTPYTGDEARILPTPYPVSDLAHKIPSHASVAIAGARLSCIDAVIGLIENGHGGPIAIYSRSGYFPSVRGTQGRIVPKFLNATHIDAIVRVNGKLTLTDIVRLVQQEISLISGEQCDEQFQLPQPPADLAAYLEDEIALARAPRTWQAVLYATNAVIDCMWAALDDKDKSRFLSEYFSAFMSYRVSIPIENAIRILAYLKSGQLGFHAGDFTVTSNEDGKPRIVPKDQSAGTALTHDYLINAMGSPRSVSQLDSDLLANLIQRGVVTAHELGGIVVDPATYQVVGATGRNVHLYAMGELTTGTFFFTSALDINARHARTCATAFAEATRNRMPLEAHELRIRQG